MADELKDRSEELSHRNSSSVARKVWHAPELTILPIENTETEGALGNDGNGPTTHS